MIRVDKPLTPPPSVSIVSEMTSKEHDYLPSDKIRTFPSFGKSTFGIS